MSSSAKDRPRRRCSVASNSNGFYTEYENKENKYSDQEKTPSKNDLNVESSFSPIARRSTRKCTPNKKYDSEFEVTNPNKRQRTPQKLKRTRDKETSESDESEELDATGEAAQKAENLFEELVDVEGKKIFGFNTPKKRDGMAIKALSTPKTQKSTIDSTKKGEKQGTKTPNSSKKQRKQDFQPKTPRHIRKCVKAEISKLLLDSSDSDFSPDESDYNPNDSFQSDSSEEETNTNESDNDEAESSELKKSRRKTSPRIPIAPLTRRRSAARKTEEYVPQSDGYFTTHSSKKITTSDHTLDRLKNPRLPHNQLFSLLASMKLSNEHEQCLTGLLDEYKRLFGKWLHVLNEGYNILLYGLGSKRNLLQTFHKEMLTNQPVIVVNGFFPSLTIKDILDGITHEILGITSTSGNLHEVVDLIAAEFSRIPQTHLFLIIHNIDGTMLRNSKTQEVLSRLATVSNIHLLASIDHINTPLLWDHSKLNNFNFSWWDATTMLPYTDETAFENSLLVQNSGDLALSSMNNVFQSLTTNARKIYMIIVKQQLKSNEDQNYRGMPFRDLYWLCRESFLVSSDLALRAQLTEFLDHKLVKSKRTVDGTEHLSIPISCGLLQQFLDQQN